MVKHLLGKIRSLKKFNNLCESLEFKAFIPASSGALEDNNYLLHRFTSAKI